MPSFNARCKFFDDDGHPLGGGCRRGTQCGFVHPDTANWATAPKSRNSINDRRSSDTSNLSRSQSRHGRNDSWGAPPSSASSAPGGWDTSSWSAPKLTSSNNTALAASSKTWGTPSAAKTSAADTSSSGNISSSANASSSTKVSGEAASSWQDLLNSGDQTNSTGNATSGWGQALASGWGNESSGSGWDNQGNGSGWGRANEGNGSGWVTEGSGGGWANEGNSSTSGNMEISGGSTGGRRSATGPQESVNDGRGGEKEDQEMIENRRKGKEKADIIMREPSPPRKALPPFLPAIRIPLSSPRTSVQEESKSSARAHDSSSRSSVILESPIVPTMSYTPLVQPSLRDVALSLLNSKSTSPESDVSAPTSTKKYTGPNGNLDLFHDHIKYMADVVVFQVLTNHAQEEDTQAKKMHLSDEYSRATQQTQIILQTHRSKYSSQFSSLKSQRDKALRHLIKLPDTSAKVNRIMGPMPTKEAIQTYAEELKEWTNDLQLHKQLLINEKAAAAPKTYQQVLEQDNWTWRDLWQVTAEFGVGLENTSINVCAKTCTKDGEDEDLTVDFKARIPTVEEDHPMADFTSDVQRTSATIETAGQGLEAPVDHLANLVLRMSASDQELENLKVQRLISDEFSEKANSMLDGFESQNDEDTAELRDLKAQIQNLYLHKRAPASSGSSTPQAITIDDVRNILQPIVYEQLKADLAPVMDAFAQHCNQNQCNIVNDLNEMVGPLQEKTNELYRNPQYQLL